MKEFLNEMKDELEQHILPFWMNLQDKEYGGFYGRVDKDYNIVKKSPKGAILNSRILFAFSRSYTLLHNNIYLVYAEIAYKFLQNNLIDNKFEGLFLIVDYKGKSLDDRKHINNLCYAVYALAEYYQASYNKEAKELAVSLFNLIESKKNEFDDYQEEFDRFWNKKTGELFDRFSLNPEFTLNSLVHILEAYTNLYKIWQNDRLLTQISKIILKLTNTVYSKKNSSFNEFFNSDWKSLINLKLYGHSMECAWILQRSLDITGIKNTTVKNILADVFTNIQKEALINNSVIYESINGKKNLYRYWWVQTEAIIGFSTCYFIFGKEIYIVLVQSLWNFIKTSLIDKNGKGEWFGGLSDNLVRLPDDDIVNLWKCPYHTTRMISEVLNMFNN